MIFWKVNFSDFLKQMSINYYFIFPFKLKFIILKPSFAEMYMMFPKIISEFLAEIPRFFPEKKVQGKGFLGSLKCFHATPKILFLPWMQFGFAENSHGHRFCLDAKFFARYSWNTDWTKMQLFLLRYNLEIIFHNM